MKNADQLLFRCHALGGIMPSDKPKVEFTKTQIDKMVEIFTDVAEHRREEINSKYLTKGNAREQDSITLLSRVTKTLFKKNTERLSNFFITGEVDVYEGPEIRKAEHTVDTKTSWSRITFNKARANALNDDYYWQGLGYMILTGARKHTVAICLVNGTAQAILDEKRKAGYGLGMMDKDGNPTPEYKEKAKQIEVNHIFDLKAFQAEYPWYEFDHTEEELSNWQYDIPMADRLHLFTFERNESDIERLYKRIAVCREWMNKNLFKLTPVAA